MARERYEKLSADLSAYLDGELSARRTEEIARAIENPNELQREYEELRAVRDKLRSLPVASIPTDLSGDFREPTTETHRARAVSLRAIGSAADAAALRRERRIAVLSFAGVFATAAAMLLVVHFWGPGLRGSELDVPVADTARRSVNRDSTPELAVQSHSEALEPVRPQVEPMSSAEESPGVTVSPTPAILSDASPATVEVTIEAASSTEFESLTAVLRDWQRENSGIDALFDDMNGIEVTGGVSGHESGRGTALNRPIEAPARVKTDTPPATAHSAYAFRMPASAVLDLVDGLERSAPNRVQIELRGDAGVLRSITARTSERKANPNAAGNPDRVPGESTSPALISAARRKPVSRPSGAAVEMLERALGEAVGRRNLESDGSEPAIFFRVRVLPPRTRK